MALLDTKLYDIARERERESRCVREVFGGQRHRSKVRYTAHTNGRVEEYPARHRNTPARIRRVGEVRPFRPSTLVFDIVKDRYRGHARCSLWPSIDTAQYCKVTVAVVLAVVQRHSSRQEGRNETTPKKKQISPCSIESV